MRDALYEAPGPKTRRRIVIGTVVASVAVVALFGLIAWRFYVTGQFAPQYWTFFTKWSTWRYLLTGLLGTFEVALTAGAIALVLGVLLMLGRISHNKVVSTIFRVVIDFFRGIPSLLLIYFFFLVIPSYGIKMPSFWMLAIPISLTASGVLAEVFRAGVNAVPRGQSEAALSLGLSPTRTFYRVVFPQALRFVIPSLISELVIVLKDTTFAYVVSYADLMQHAKVLITSHDALVSVYLVVAVIYILINYALNMLSDRIARGNRLPAVQRQGGTA
jgi:glutamate transport system permease protein